MNLEKQAAAVAAEAAATLKCDGSHVATVNI